MYVIKRLPDGQYLARRGYKFAYTINVNYVRFFETEEEADKERCSGNEIVLDILELFER